jgi:hypothetical protein
MSEFTESKVNLVMTPDYEKRVIVMSLGDYVKFEIPVERATSLIRDIALMSQQILSHAPTAKEKTS